jgi:hypothetical protein
MPDGFATMYRKPLLGCPETLTTTLPVVAACGTVVVIDVDDQLVGAA